MENLQRMQMDQLKKAKKLMFQRLEQRNPYRTFSLLELFFKSIMNIIITLINMRISASFHKDKREWQEIGVMDEVERVVLVLHVLVVFQMFCLLSTCLLIVPRTRCLQRELHSYVVKIYYPFQVVTLVLQWLLLLALRAGTHELLSSEKISKSIGNHANKMSWSNPFQMMSAYGYRKNSTQFRREGQEDPPDVLPLYLFAKPLWLQQYTFAITALICFQIYGHLIYFTQTYLGNCSGLRADHTIPPRQTLMRREQ